MAGGWKSTVGPVEMHYQDDPDAYCGAASLMMSLGAAEPGAPLVQQESSYPFMHDYSDGWLVSPPGLALGFGTFKTASLDATFQPCYTTDAAGMASLVVAALSHADAIPPVVCMTTHEHWSVPVAVETDVEPTQPFRVKTIWVNVPSGLPQSPKLPGIPPHQRGDACTTQLTPAMKPWRGWLESVIPITALPAAGRCAGVFSDRLAPVGPIITDLLPARWTVRNLRMDERRLITASEAQDAAVSAAVEFDLAPSEAGLTPDTAHLVQRLDRTDSYYYLVTIRRGSEKTLLGTARIDAWDGGLLEVSFDERDAGTVADRDLFSERLYRNVIDTQLENTTRLVPRGVSFSPVLAWRACAESFSPFHPFYQLTVGGRVLFLDQGGTVYARLTRPRRLTS
ncbi:MAG: hypothetical protein JWM87_2732 [Candidatus Eremiobacteraeota bacterium]|nr:hypothetical protein [Candidatus Eremiobacteraeota bacterium]